MPAPAPTHCYVLGFSDGVIKVGRTSNPINRFGNHADSAKVRRAHITQTWLFETEDAKSLEWHLILWARTELERLTGEWFSGDFVSFMAHVERMMRRVGFIPTETFTSDQVIRELGVDPKVLLCALDEEHIRPWGQVKGGRRLFMKDELLAWMYGGNFAFWMRLEDQLIPEPTPA